MTGPLECKFDPSQTSGIHEDWKNLRSALEHEDGLINQRLVWMLAFSGFLFAAYAYSLSAEATLITAQTCPDESRSTCPSTAEQVLLSNIQAMRIAVCVAGAGAALAALVGTLAAFLAIVRFAGDFLKNACAEQKRSFYCHPIGRGGSHKMGVASGLSFPCLTFSVWLALGLRQADAHWPDTLIFVLVLSGLIFVSAYKAIDFSILETQDV